MSVDEYAALELACGARLAKTGTRWWRRVRPCFYRPLFPFEEISPDCVQRPLASRFGGVQYLVPDGVAANSQMNFVLFEEPQSYSLGQLKRDDRHKRKIRKAEKIFSVRRITSAEELSSKGHSAYLSFFNRTKYSYRADRVQYGRFAAWAETLLSFPNALVLGAFDADELVAVAVSYLVEGVVFYSTYFSKTEAMSKNVTDLMLHKIREGAAALPSARFIFAARAGMERGITAFYLMRGARMVSRPALLVGNPLSMFLVRTCMRESYQKLVGGDDSSCENPGLEQKANSASNVTSRAVF